MNPVFETIPSLEICVQCKVQDGSVKSVKGSIGKTQSPIEAHYDEGRQVVQATVKNITKENRRDKVCCCCIVLKTRLFVVLLFTSL
jgi:hypothetical protein